MARVKFLVDGPLGTCVTACKKNMKCHGINRRRVRHHHDGSPRTLVSMACMPLYGCALPGLPVSASHHR